MPHEGDESDSSSSDVDDLNGKGKYSDADGSEGKSNDFGQRDSSNYTGEESYESDAGTHMENVSGDEECLARRKGNELD